VQAAMPHYKRFARTGVIRRASSDRYPTSGAGRTPPFFCSRKETDHSLLARESVTPIFCARHQGARRHLQKALSFVEVGRREMSQGKQVSVRVHGLPKRRRSRASTVGPRLGPTVVESVPSSTVLMVHEKEPDHRDVPQLWHIVDLDTTLCVASLPVVEVRIGTFQRRTAEIKVRRRATEGPQLWSRPAGGSIVGCVTCRAPAIDRLFELEAAMPLQRQVRKRRRTHYRSRCEPIWGIPTPANQRTPY